MSRLSHCFTQLKAQQRKALIPFITAGDPSADITLDIMHGLVEKGADVIELGMPFSDPMADGTVIQRASERALEAGTRLRHVFDIVEKFRQTNTKTPIVLMGYLNPVEIMGYEAFAVRSQEVGVDGVLLVDLPPEEMKNIEPIFNRYELAPIFLLAPTTTAERMAQICQHAQGYVYYVSVKGVTGSQKIDPQAVADKVAEIRQYTDLPIGVGFGISDAETAAAIGQVSDAVIVGSALVKHVETHNAEELATVMPQFLAGLRHALDAV